MINSRSQEPSLSNETSDQPCRCDGQSQVFVNVPMFSESQMNNGTSPKPGRNGIERSLCQTLRLPSA